MLMSFEVYDYNDEKFDVDYLNIRDISSVETAKFIKENNSDKIIKLNSKSDVCFVMFNSGIIRTVKYNKEALAKLINDYLYTPHYISGFNKEGM